jgi:hypothetical protein
VGGIACLLVTDAHAQIDEIQVYDADINSPGQFSVQLHNNYTPIGRKLPDFEGRIGPNHTLNGVPEWAYGVADWLELGVYLPVRLLKTDKVVSGAEPTLGDLGVQLRSLADFLAALKDKYS